MIIKIKEIVDYLDEVFRPELQEDYDNSGFLVGRGEAECTGVLVALDLTDGVLAEAMDMGANLIVTHHPLIFGGVKRITDRNDSGRLLMKLICNGVAVYAAHTNLDNLPWGVNGALGERLGLANCHILKQLDCSEEEAGAGMVGELATGESLGDFLQRVKAVLGLSTLRYAGGQGVKTMKRVAFCGGSGAFLIGDAVASRADIYLTADLKYHDFQRATATMALADIGHYESEQFAKDIIFSVISRKFSNFACRISEKQGSLVSYI